MMFLRVVTFFMVVMTIIVKSLCLLQASSQWDVGLHDNRTADAWQSYKNSDRSGKCTQIFLDTSQHGLIFFLFTTVRKLKSFQHRVIYSWKIYFKNTTRQNCSKISEEILILYFCNAFIGRLCSLIFLINIIWLPYTSSYSTLLSNADLQNQTAPADSKVLIVGMADGDFLYQFLGNRTHPFGRWRNDLTYADVYEWWNCMQVSLLPGL